MATIKLPPIRVSVEMPEGDHLEKGQEVVLTFLEIPTNEALDRLQCATEAAGYQTEYAWGNLTCRIKVVKDAIYQSKDAPAP